MKVDSQIILQNVRCALQEDIGSGDVTAQLLAEDKHINAIIISRMPMVMCGQPWVDAVFSEVHPNIRVNWLVEEGAYISKPAYLCKVEGPVRSVLTAERTALNFMQTLSGTATQVLQFSQALAGSPTRLLDTRKTIPGLRHAQKYAVLCGGGVNHRHGLYDAVLIKENHIRSCGSITLAVEKAKELNPGLLIEVEVEDLIELEEALKARPNRIMLDNFNSEMIQAAVKMRHDKSIAYELSGGLDLDSIARLKDLGVDYISVGALTKHLQAIDLSLLVEKEEH